MVHLLKNDFYFFYSWIEPDQVFTYDILYLVTKKIHTSGSTD